MKKIIAVAAVAPLLLAAMPLLASAHSWNNSDPSNSGETISISNYNGASVTNNVNTESNSGANFTSGSGNVKTGRAASESDVLTGVNANYTSVSSCGCSGSVKSIVVGNSNEATVTNNVNTRSNSGANFTVGGSSHDSHSWDKSSGSSVKTGAASSLGNVVTIGNVNITELN